MRPETVMIEDSNQGLWAWEIQPGQAASSKEMLCYHILSPPINSFFSSIPISFLQAVLSKLLWAYWSQGTTLVRGWRCCWGRSLPGQTRALCLNQGRGELTTRATYVSGLLRVPCRVLGCEVFPLISERVGMVTSIIPGLSLASAPPSKPSLNRHLLASLSATFPGSS